MIRVLHTADWHLRGKNLDEIEKCLLFMVEWAIKNAPDVIVISGDLTDSRALQLESKSAQILLDIIQKLLNIAPVAIVTGTPSHDGKTALALKSCRGEFQILVSDMPDQFGYHDKNIEEGWYRLDSGFFTPGFLEPKFIITQIPTPTKQYFVNDMNVEDSDNAIADAMGVMFFGFGQHAEIYKNAPHIVNAHLSVGGAFISETQQLIGRDIEVSSGQLQALNADVVCLGHIHKSQGIGKNIFYAGSVARMNHGEKEDKGFYVHHCDKISYEFVDRLESVFIKTPARKLLEIKQDFTKLENNPEKRSFVKPALNLFDDPGAEVKNDIIVLDTGSASDVMAFLKASLDPWDLPESDLKITLTLWQDDAAIVDKKVIEEYFINSGCSAVRLFLIRKPRENVRSYKVLEEKLLPDKLVVMAELRGEAIEGSVLLKAADLEANETDSWERDYKTIKESQC